MTRALDLILAQPWAIQPDSLETLLSIASRTNASPEAVAAQLGRPLDNARTVNVPAGRPIKGRPPFTWSESAEDALTMPGKQFDKVTDWSIAHALWLLESFNGHGYRNAIGIHSPYLWAGTCHYVRGKYIDDHVYSALAVSKQPGAAGIIAAIAPEIVPAAGGAAGRTGRP